MIDYHNTDDVENPDEVRLGRIRRLASFYLVHITLKIISASLGPSSSRQMLFLRVQFPVKDIYTIVRRLRMNIQKGPNIFAPKL